MPIVENWGNILFFEKGNAKECADYCPITLTSCVWIIFYTMTSNCLVFFFVKNKFLDLKLEHFYRNVRGELLKGVAMLKIRDEYKTWIYYHFITSCVRFILVMHHFFNATVNEIEIITNKFIKKWLNLPLSANSNFLLGTELSWKRWK